MQLNLNVTTSLSSTLQRNLFLSSSKCAPTSRSSAVTMFKSTGEINGPVNGMRGPSPPHYLQQQQQQQHPSNGTYSNGWSGGQQQHQHMSCYRFQRPIRAPFAQSYPPSRGSFFPRNGLNNYHHQHHQQQQHHHFVPHQQQQKYQLNQQRDSSSSSLSPTNSQGLEPSMKQIKILVNHNRGANKSENEHSNEHQLEDVWTFWYLRFEKNFSWDHSQLEIGDCHSVEQFWGIFDQLLPLTDAHHGCNYSLFKKGIRPIWEDPMNRHGGRLVFTITKENPAYKEFADRMWLEFAMAVVGNVLANVSPDLSHQICGIIGGNRNNLIKIAVWTRDCQKLDEAKKIGHYFKKIANYHGMVPYEMHMDSQSQRPNGKILFKI